jgi:hypothetical protein
MPLSRADCADADDGGYLRNSLGADADHALARHPAGRARAADAAAAPKGPDDDQEFLRALDRAIRRNPPVS